MNTTHARTCWIVLGIALLLTAPVAAQKRPLTLEDIMQFRQVRGTVISEDGRWLAYEAYPDRGNGSVQVHSTRTRTRYEIERGSAPVFSRNGHWLAATLKLPFQEQQEAKRGSKTPMVLLNTTSGDLVEFERVLSFGFSKDSRWLAYHLALDQTTPVGEAETGADDDESDRPKSGSVLVLRRLESGEETRVESVTSFAFDAEARYLAYVQTTADGQGNGVFSRHLSVASGAEVAISRRPDGVYSPLAWSHEGSRLAYVIQGGEQPAALEVWDDSSHTRRVISEHVVPDGWKLPADNDIGWMRDGERLFVGLRPDWLQELNDETETKGEEAVSQPEDPFDRETILSDRDVDVWHWRDPRIVSNQKKLWTQTRKRLYDAVVSLEDGTLRLLADEEMPEIRRTKNARAVLGLSDVPYLRQITWEGRFRDAYRVDLESGDRELVARKLQGDVSFSPEGRYATWFQDNDWHLYDSQSRTTTNITEPLEVPFYDEDHDYPSTRPSYGSAGWVEGESALLIYDKYDLWKFPLPAGEPVCLTEGKGRKEERTFRALQLDPKQLSWDPDKTMYLRSYHQKRKSFGFYSLNASGTGLRRLVEADKRFDFVAKAREADVFVYTRQDYGEFPDLWVAGNDVDGPRRITNVNPQIEEFALGSSELVEWKSLDGIPLQGVLIKPGNFEEGKRYPVIVYFYRFFSQRLHEFNQMVINHRPNFAFYASNGYAIFLPDIRFEVGTPGFSATKCLVPGVQKLIDSGVADPDAIGLHGHSWSGYQTAFVITQTNIFAAAAAGAPVSNMTSAYSGIRWQTGLARQFQYEKTQSRIGGSLWEFPERYIENSPVFFADRIETPLLIEFGDQDGAVPWYQGIELYLAMRRLEKPAVFLQYRAEPHHLQKYANKLDYTIKMKEFFDHFLKGAEAPEWWSSGVPYLGR